MLSNCLFAQNDTLIINNDYRFKIGVKGLLERGIFNIPSSEYMARDVSSESILFNYGVLVNYKLKNKYSSIESGIYFIKRASYYEFTSKSNNNILFLLVRKEYNNIQFPLKYRIDTKFLYFSLGGYMEFLTSTSTKRADLFNNSLLINEKDRNFNLGVIASLGFEKAMTNNISIFFETNFSSNLTSFKQNESFWYFSKEPQNHLQNYGFGLGITYKI